MGRRDDTIEVTARLLDALVMRLALICRPCVNHPWPDGSPPGGMNSTGPGIDSMCASVSQHLGARNWCRRRSAMRAGLECSPGAIHGSVPLPFALQREPFT